MAKKATAKKAVTSKVQVKRASRGPKICSTCDKQYRTKFDLDQHQRSCSKIEGSECPNPVYENHNLEEYMTYQEFAGTIQAESKRISENPSKYRLLGLRKIQIGEAKLYAAVDPLSGFLVYIAKEWPGKTEIENIVFGNQKKWNIYKNHYENERLKSGYFFGILVKSDRWAIKK